MASCPITSWQIDGETVETVRNFILLGSKITLDGDCSHEIKRHLFLGRKVMMNLDSILKSRDITFPPKVHPSSQSYDLSSSHIWMWESDHTESWVLRDWCFWTVVLEKTLGSPLDCKRSNQSILKKISPKYSLEGPPDVKNWLIWKDPDAGKDWRQEEKGTEDEMVGCHHWFDGHEFEQALGVDDVQGSLARCSPWNYKESDMPEQLNWTERTTSQFITFTKQSDNTKYE